MNTRKPVVLLTPLDWGLGHTIRCIPIVKELLENDCEVILACNSKQKHILSQEFPFLRYVQLKGYDISYGNSRLTTFVELIRQTPKILMAIKREQVWLVDFLSTNHVDLIISDNRYGISSSSIPSVFMTHQLRVRTGLGRIVDLAVQKKLYSFINRFSLCWVPDSDDLITNAAGSLSHPAKFPETKVEYIGILSRLEICIEGLIENDVLVILSGPEPQRTMLETKIMRELKKFQGTAVVVRGLTDRDPLESSERVTVIDYASTIELNKLICRAENVVCRAGYTSVMDMLKLGKKVILIPTPGQAEQEYLGKHLVKNRLALIIPQKNLSLKNALAAANKLTTKVFSNSADQYKVAVRSLVDSVRKKESVQSASGDFGKSKK